MGGAPRVAQGKVKQIYRSCDRCASIRRGGHQRTTHRVQSLPRRPQELRRRHRPRCHWAVRISSRVQPARLLFRLSASTIRRGEEFPCQSTTRTLLRAATEGGLLAQSYRHKLKRRQQPSASATAQRPANRERMLKKVVSNAVLIARKTFGTIAHR